MKHRPPLFIIRAKRWWWELSVNDLARVIIAAGLVIIAVLLPIVAPFLGELL